MKASELIGRFVLRTRAPAEIDDHSYTADWIYILEVTDDHIFYRSRNTGVDAAVLDHRWLDDFWIEWPPNVHVPNRERVIPK